MMSRFLHAPTPYPPDDVTPARADPAGTGAAGFVGKLLPSATVGCGGTAASPDLAWFGLAADFSGQLSAPQTAPTTFHIDCRPPVTATSACTVSRVWAQHGSPAAEAMLTDPVRAALLSGATSGDAIEDALATIAARYTADEPASGSGRRLETPANMGVSTNNYFSWRDYFNFTTRFQTFASNGPTFGIYEGGKRPPGEGAHEAGGDLVAQPSPILIAAGSAPFMQAPLRRRQSPPRVDRCRHGQPAELHARREDSDALQPVTRAVDR